MEEERCASIVQKFPGPGFRHHLHALLSRFPISRQCLTFLLHLHRPAFLCRSCLHPLEPQNDAVGESESSYRRDSSPRFACVAAPNYLPISISDTESVQETANSIVSGGITYVTYLFTTRIRPAAANERKRERERWDITMRLTMGVVPPQMMTMEITTTVKSYVSTFCNHIKYIH
ncbi:hypothetical protein Cni_G06233 [Canna indica]|uniref:Uncharacterized protein n=1 Tax=Canna indica TaxID=4628 RepID=A0AAQ3Q5S0_9LILI|nr:hypothetical protein Cni_G06233 [Canna indica]